MLDEAIKLRSSALLGQCVVQISRLYGGRNSQVFKLTCSDNTQYALKVYLRDSFLGRDRLRTETTSLQFLWSHNIRCIPQPIISDNSFGYAIYEYIEGVKITPEAITADEIDDAAKLLLDIDRCRYDVESNNLPSASEARYSARDIDHNLKIRSERLLKIKNSGPVYEELEVYLKREFTPIFNMVVRWAEQSLLDSQITVSKELSIQNRILSPSDFGFHNALKRGSETVFLDFEYFGWDDPVKTISDFIIHPGMDLTEEMKRRFVSLMLNNFATSDELLIRLRYLYPLFGLKWCLILLNEFLPESLHRLEFVSGGSVDKTSLQRVQLQKSMSVLGKLRQGFERFPYCD